MPAPHGCKLTQLTTRTAGSPHTSRCKERQLCTDRKCQPRRPRATHCFQNDNPAPTRCECLTSFCNPFSDGRREVSTNQVRKDTLMRTYRQSTAAMAVEG